MRARIGDWVRFYRDGLLIIGQVEYISVDITGHEELHTDQGTVRTETILEARSPAKDEEK